MEKILTYNHFTKSTSDICDKNLSWPVIEFNLDDVSDDHGERHLWKNGLKEDGTKEIFKRDESTKYS